MARRPNSRSGTRAESVRRASSASSNGDHDFVSVRIDAHGQVSRFFRCINGRPQNFATRGGQSVAGREQVVDLEIKPGPCAVTLSATVDSEDATRNDQLRHHIRLMHYFSAKYLTIKSDRPCQVLSPDNVLQFFDAH
jgi:hypothetical protein